MSRSPNQEDSFLNSVKAVPIISREEMQGGKTYKTLSYVRRQNWLLIISLLLPINIVSMYVNRTESQCTKRSISQYVDGIIINEQEYADYFWTDQSSCQCWTRRFCLNTKKTTPFLPLKRSCSLSQLLEAFSCLLSPQQLSWTPIQIALFPMFFFSSSTTE